MRWKALNFALILLLSSFFLPKAICFEETYVFQPCLSNNISIMRNNDYSSIEQPLVVTSGFRTDCRQPSDERGLLKFDISSLPKGYRVKSAKLHLYVLGVFMWDGKKWAPLASLARTIQVHRITTNWTGWSLTYWSYATFPDKLWNTPGGDFEPATDAVKTEVPRAWNVWTVTRDVEAWYSGESPNYGWLLKDANEGDPTGYRVEYNNWFYVIAVEYSPKLEVTLTAGLSLPKTYLAFAIALPTALAILALKITRKKL